ncbi:MAG: hypothetical protein DRP08_05050 [Candidatus Aenigmatarchaeota archaeon]|nr:MAG: hypothetical protein DRP08_05050 [Candidatus Aenigmarchaeota archaeon]
MSNLEILPQKYRLALVFRQIFFPFTYPDFLDSLKAKNFDIIPKDLPLFSGPRAYVSGLIAKKQNCIVHLDADKKFLATEGRSVNDVIKVYAQLVKIAEENFKVKKEDIEYLETISDLVIKSTKNPLLQIHKILQTTQVIKKFCDILGIEVSLYALRITPKEAYPGDKNWFDIAIEPRITKPEDEYYVQVIYRNEDTNKALEFLNQVNERIIRLIQIIEGQL